MAVPGFSMSSWAGICQGSWLGGAGRQLCSAVGAKSRENTLDEQGMARDQLAANIGGGKDRCDEVTGTLVALGALRTESWVCPAIQGEFSWRKGAE